MATSDSESGGDSNRDAPRIVRTEGVLGGDPRIEGRRIGVFDVYHRYVEGGEPPESISDAYDLTVAEVHAALAYAFHNADEMRSIADRDREVPGGRAVPGEDS